MNEKKAIEFATINGLSVTDTVRHRGGLSEFRVGALRVYCSGRPVGKCWRVEGRGPESFWPGEAIEVAVRAQTPLPVA